jgi:hypothetical protein
MGFVQKVRQLVTKANSTKDEVWRAFQKRSAEYARALKLSDHDLATIEQEVQPRGSVFPDIMETGEKGFLKIKVQGEDFSLAIKHVCGCHYGGDWRDYIFAICMSNPRLNQTIGNGTTTISIVLFDWHEKILRHLKNGEDGPKQLAIVHQLPPKK